MDILFVIEFLSKEWMKNVFITTFFMLIYFYVSFKIKDKHLMRFLKTSALLVIGMTLANHLILMTYGSWMLKKDLPLHLCSITALICCIIFFVKKKQFLFEFLFD